MVVQDAVMAREQGNYDRAIALLERSFEVHPEHAGVRVELSTTLLEREGVDLFDVERILNHFTNPTSGS